MSRKKKKDPVGATVHHEMMKYNVLDVLDGTGSLYSDTDWYSVVLGQYKLVLLGNW